MMQQERKLEKGVQLCEMQQRDVHIGIWQRRKMHISPASSLCNFLVISSLSLLSMPSETITALLLVNGSEPSSLQRISFLSYKAALGVPLLSTTHNKSRYRVTDVYLYA